MRALLVAVLVLAGLVVGSWQRAVVFWQAFGAGEAPRLCCPACGHRLLAGPRPALSVLRPAGRCPACTARFGPPPASMELTTAVLLGLLGALLTPSLVLAALCFLAVCAVPLGYIDAAVARLPNVLTGPAYIGTLLLLTLAAAASGQWHQLARAALGGLALAACFALVALISPSAVGGGDLRLAASVGTALAWYGGRVLLAGVLAGFVLAAVYGLGLLAARRATLRQHIPYGPFMIAGMFLAILAGAG
jgi:leader peptidase (prepilin peptidase) / N-methyltransferase